MVLSHYKESYHVRDSGHLFLVEVRRSEAGMTTPGERINVLWLPENKYLEQYPYCLG